jgi:hypothetical protein
MDDTRFDTPVNAYDLRNTRLDTVDDALSMILSERFEAYRYTRERTERYAWTDTLHALTEAKASPSPDAVRNSRSAVVRLLAFARRFLDHADEPVWGGWGSPGLEHFPAGRRLP